MDIRNTREGYEPENATKIPDDEDHGAGFSAGDRVVISEDHAIYPDEEGEVYAVARVDDMLVVDVLIDGTSDVERFDLDEIAGGA